MKLTIVGSWSSTLSIFEGYLEKQVILLWCTSIIGTKSYIPRRLRFYCM